MSTSAVFSSERVKVLFDSVQTVLELHVMGDLIGRDLGGMLTECGVSKPERAVHAGLEPVGCRCRDHADELIRTGLELHDLAATYNDTDTGRPGLEAAP